MTDALGETLSLAETYRKILRRKSIDPVAVQVAYVIRSTGPYLQDQRDKPTTRESDLMRFAYDAAEEIVDMVRNAPEELRSLIEGKRE